MLHRMYWNWHRDMMSIACSTFPAWKSMEGLTVQTDIVYRNKRRLKAGARSIIYAAAGITGGTKVTPGKFAPFYAREQKRLAK